MRINPEQQFNQQWTGTGNQLADDGELDQEQNYIQDQGEEGEEEGDEEGESVYMIDGVVMRMIQIEGEEQQYLMDPQGRIYDM